MSRITLDATLRSKLNGMNESMEICDESGKLVGHFVTPAEYRQMLYAYAEAQCPHTPEQLEELRKQTGGKPLAQIWKELGRT